PLRSTTGGMPFTLIRAVSCAVLKAVAPPLTDASAVPPLVPVVWSQARNCMPGSTVPLNRLFGTKRTRVELSDASSRAVVSVGEPIGFQVLPLSVLYCQLPLVLSTLLMAMPETAPTSTSVIRLGGAAEAM